MKNYLFLFRKAAHTGVLLQETLDMILTVAAFDQQVSLLLLDDGVFHLKNNQHTESLGVKNTAAIFKALAYYDVHSVYAEAESLAERGINKNDLFLPVKVLHRAEIANLMQQSDLVIAA